MNIVDELMMKAELNKNVNGDSKKNNEPQNSSKKGELGIIGRVTNHRRCYYSTKYLY